VRSQPKSKKPEDGEASPGGARAGSGEPALPERGRRPKDEPTPAARALRLLARREHTRRELERKLAPHVEDPAELARLLDDFTERGWLSEARAAEQLVRAKRGRFGAARIRQTLADKGVPPDLIKIELEALKAGELDNARAVWARKFKTAPATQAERARHVRFLQARGFSVEIALRVVRGAANHDAGDS
jgi:regulatory protein